MIYRWKEGARISVDPQAAGDELERIRVRHNGRLEPEWVVHTAKAAKNPLHDLFEWDDNVAAQNYRVDQARGIIRSIEVVVEAAEERKPMRAFVSVVQERDRSYTSVVHAMSDPDLRKQVLRAALTELEAWRKRYAELVELAQVFAAIDEARGAE
ncbi:hypothetical protein [Novosphingobium sp. EMRT-2]|uniref:hypothetical protein n=1 Tax=Novosphingobium sp. EMRT-2 TaxID=2571749 RepID=UPI0010BE1228|nr:hypothetical protein [Novosphingobium sp. EMRT-2]QCI93376.1 hypothetical protein FA702_07285 [Novosphingobium sp. EMRT-2]